MEVLRYLSPLNLSLVLFCAFGSCLSHVDIADYHDAQGLGLVGLLHLSGDWL